MSKHRTHILTKYQKELLSQLLELAEDREEVLTLTGLEGFLFGIAITPDVIMLSEWMPEIFCGEMPEFEDIEQGEVLIKNLLNAYNAYNDAFNKEKLNFPFDVKNIKDEDINDDLLNEMADWSYGLLVALRLRPEIWHLDYEGDYENAPEDIQDILLSFSIVYGVVYPEDAHGLFEREDGQPVDASSTVAFLFASLPMAVERLKEHGEKLSKSRIEEMKKGIFDFNQRKVKIGRNDPCPCGSGKKYKKCCGAN